MADRFTIDGCVCDLVVQRELASWMVADSDGTVYSNHDDEPAARAAMARFKRTLICLGWSPDYDNQGSGQPRRVRLSRAKGWRMPAHTVKVDRSTRWGNPWSIEKAREVGYTGTDAELRRMCVSVFDNACDKRLPAVEAITANIEQLRGKNLACWCPIDEPCHADILLVIANA